MEHVALEVGPAGDAGELRVRQEPEVHDDVPRPDCVVPVRVDDPAPGRVVPDHVAALGPEAAVLVEPCGCFRFLAFLPRPMDFKEMTFK